MSGAMTVGLGFSVRRRNPSPSASVAAVCLILDLESAFREGENGEGISMIVKHAIPYIPLLRTGEAGLYHGPVGPEHDSATRSLPPADKLLFDRGVIGAGGRFLAMKSGRETVLFPLIYNFLRC